MNARVALATLLSLLALLPTRSEDLEARVKRRADPPWARPSSANNFHGPPGHGRPGNKFGGGNGPPGLADGGPPGLNRGRPSGWGQGRPWDTGTRWEDEDGNERPDNGKPSGGKKPFGTDDEVPTGPDRGPNGGHGFKGCKNDEFRCGGNTCISKSRRCDNNIDCPDSSDEANCEAPIENTSGCILPSQPEGGSYELGGCGNPCQKRTGDIVPRNSLLTYTCRDDYVLIGNTISICVNDEWYNPPACRKTCAPLSSTSVKIVCTYQGDVVPCNERIKPGTRATLSCKQSYKLPLTDDPAYREITCLEDGLWDRRLFRCLPECGTPIAHGNTLIVNGFEAKIGVFPWHVGIYNKNSETEYEQICGGALINSNLVVSAAHCFYDEVYSKMRDESNFAVAAGKHFRDWNAKENYVQKSKVSKIWLRERYRGAGGNFAEDIAVIKLETPFELTALVRPVCVDWSGGDQLRGDQVGKTVGWGRTIAGEPSETLQEINMPAVSYDQCLAGVPEDFRGYITPDKFCAGRLNGSSLCDGDSGGGLCFQERGTWYLRGVVSVGPVSGHSCNYNSYVGFTYVSHFRDWIRDIYVKA